MAQPTISVALNDGNSTVVTVDLPGVAVVGTQANTRKASYVDASGTSVEVTIPLPGYTPVGGSE